MPPVGRSIQFPSVPSSYPQRPKAPPAIPRSCALSGQHSAALRPGVFSASGQPTQPFCDDRVSASCRFRKRSAAATFVGGPLRSFNASADLTDARKSAAQNGDGFPRKRIKSFCVAIASLKLWLDEISAVAGLEFWRQLGRRESWFESDEASSCECGWQKVACLQHKRGLWKVLDVAPAGSLSGRARRISRIGGGRRMSQ